MFSAHYSRWDDDKAWSSQEWKADKSIDDRTGQPVVTFWGETLESQSIFFHQKAKHVIVKEEEPHDRTGQLVVHPQRETMSMESRSFLNRASDQMRKRRKRSSMNVTENDEKHSMTLGMFMSVTLESAVFMGKNYLDNCHSITNVRDLTLKQMFDISARLVSEQDEIYGAKTINWEHSSWKYLSLIGDEQIINLQRTKFTYFQILYCVLEI